MPILNVSENVDFDICNLLAIMTFPNAEVDRRKYHLINQTHQNLKDLKQSEFLLSRADVELLLESPSYVDFTKLVKEESKKAFVAGDLLALIYLMSKFEITEPSFNKAIHIMQQHALTYGVIYGDGDRLPYSKQTIRNCWNEFKSVAHFWAALRLNQDYQICEESRVISENGYKPFIEVANGILKFGQEFISFRQKGGSPLLDDDVWMLPNTIATRNLATDTFPSQMAELLKNYKA